MFKLDKSLVICEELIYNVWMYVCITLHVFRHVAVISTGKFVSTFAAINQFNAALTR